MATPYCRGPFAPKPSDPIHVFGGDVVTAAVLTLTGGIVAVKTLEQGPLVTNTTLTGVLLKPYHQFPEADPVALTQPVYDLTTNTVLTATLQDIAHVSIIGDIVTNATLTGTLARQYGLLEGDIETNTTLTATLTSDVQQGCGYVSGYCAETCLLEIWNIATSILNLTAIESTTENTPQRKAITDIWHLVRRKFYTDHNWNSNKATIALVDSTETPVARWSYAFTLPTCCLRVIYLNGAENQPSVTQLWEIELSNDKRSKLLYTDEPTAKIEYLTDIEDVGLLLAGTAHALGLELAMWLGPRFGKDASEMAHVTQMWNTSLKNAKSVDSMEQHPIIMGSNELIDARI